MGPPGELGAGRHGTWSHTGAGRGGGWIVGDPQLPHSFILCTSSTNTGQH